MTPEPAKPRPVATNENLSESDLASDRMGNNQLEGNDQQNVRNQRKEVPDAKEEPDDVRDSFRKLDKDTRAREDLGKGNRSGKS